jgi:G2/mitotic-specific cyclin-B, other
LNPIAGHEVTEDNRLRIVDWFVQVFRVLKVTNQETFFLAVSLLDNYMLEKSNRGVTLTADNLYLIGMSSVFIASKYEDIVPIFMK